MIRVTASFSNRREAGGLLGGKLAAAGRWTHPLVLGLPRGGVPVAFEVALELDAPLDVFTVRKLGVPGNEELAFGAIATGGIRVFNREIIEQFHISTHVADEVGDKAERELRWCEQAYRHTSAPPPVQGRQVILVDDGIATGATMQAAVNAVRIAGAAWVVVAVPVAARESVAKLRKQVDRMITLAVPAPFCSVGRFFQDFSPTTDGEVQELLRIAAARP